MKTQITPEQIQKRAEEIRVDCDKDYDESPIVGLDRHMRDYTFRKLAELELKIEALTNVPIPSTDKN